MPVFLEFTAKPAAPFLDYIVELATSRCVIFLSISCDNIFVTHQISETGWPYMFRSPVYCYSKPSSFELLKS